MLICFLLAGACLGYSQVDVLTYHNDGNRTGWNSRETALDTSNVVPGTFGKLFSRVVDDQVYTQPLLVNGVVLPAVGSKTLVYVATTNNTVYAFDAENKSATDPYWQVNLTPAGYRPPNAGDVHSSICGGRGGFNNFSNQFGIVGTPVIDKAANTLFVVCTVVSNTGVDNHAWDNNELAYTSTGFHQFLHALDLSTGLEKPNSPVEITAQANGTGDGNVAGVISLDTRRQFVRAGLVLSRGIVYLAFSSYCDWNPYHGWVLGYDAASLQQKTVFITTPDDGRGAIWMCGAAPAVDASGNLYFATGNGSGVGDPAVKTNRGLSILKVAPDAGNTALHIESYFTPHDYLDLDDHDLDFDTQVLLVPNSNLLFAGGKNGFLLTMDSANLGGFHAGGDSVLSAVHLGTGAVGMHSNFSYFRSGSSEFLYLASENTGLKAFPIDRPNHTLGDPIENPNDFPSGYSGGFAAVSSNDTSSKSGILWIYQAVPNCDAAGGSCNGLLRAFKAADITQEIWNSKMTATDNPGMFSKMSSVTIANGKVYVPTISKNLTVYGLLFARFNEEQAFQAMNVNNTYSALQWTGADSKYTDHFEVEKSDDGINFQTLTTVPSSGQDMTAYSAQDNAPKKGLNYYRLKQDFISGTIAYSAVKTVVFNNQAIPIIYPNPANSQITTVKGDEPIEAVSLFDMSGKRLQQISNAEGLSAITVPLGNVAAGVYVLVIRTTTQTYKHKIIRQ